MNVFLWFFVDSANQRTYKIYVFARNLSEAMQRLERVPLDVHAAYQVKHTDPQVFKAPWVEVNISANGKAISYCYGPE